MNGKNDDTSGPAAIRRLVMADALAAGQSGLPSRQGPSLPPVPTTLSSSHDRGEIFREEGTNVLRVPFGVRQAKLQRGVRPERWATLVLPFQAAGGPTPTPPQAA
ncbi:MULTISPECIES: hypothetical protein [unclassified Synechococcus]|jgi:hypothetical protein|uniref:hypothetical protein n=1 Tax=unclassified Synechococcus TaxID=2626047 RepID=UPI0037D9D4A5